MESLQYPHKILIELIQQAEDMLFITDLESGKFIEANKAAEDTLGYTRTEFLTMGPGDIEASHPLENEEFFEAHVLDLKSLDAPFQVEGHHIHKDGSVIPVSVTVTQQTYRGREYILASCRPLQDKKKYPNTNHISEQDHELSNQAMRILLNEHGQIAVSNSLGNLIYVNERFCKILGYDLEELLGKHQNTFYTGLHNRKYLTSIWRKIRSGKSWQGELIATTKSGEYFKAITTVIPTLNKNKDVSSFILFSADYTIVNAENTMGNQEPQRNVAPKTVDASQTAADPSKSLHRPPDSIPVRTEGPIQILLIEDNEDNRLLFESYLHNSGYKLDMASNGFLGLELFKKRHFDLVLLDIHMPVMDGHKAAEEIRNWEKEAGREPVTIIVLSAYAAPEDIKKSKDTGCNLHVSKPIKKIRLMEIIHNYTID